MSAAATVTAVSRLHALEPQVLPFAPSLDIRAFRLHRPRGDILIYSTEHLAGLDGISRHYLGHGHEAMFASEGLAAPLFVHEDDAAAARKAYHVRATFSRRHVLDEDFEVIPIPGHTPGSTAYLWDTGEHRLLFSADSIYLDDGEWVDGLLGSSDRQRYLKSLALIRELDFDVLVPWAATRGGPYLAPTDKADTRRRLDAIERRLASEA